MSDVVLVLSTVGAEDAERIATALVERRLAACVNVVPGLTSIYRWKDKVERDEERLLVMKTTAAGAPALREAVLELHPYELPEVVVLPVSDGHGPYLDWVRQNVG